MSKLFRNSRETFFERAQEREIATKTVEPQTPSQPTVYRGTMPTPQEQVSSPSFAMLPRNRKITTRKISTFNTILILFGAAGMIVLYISNIIAVDHLMMEINNLQKQHQRMVSEQEILKAEINRLSSLERINRKATEELGLMNPKEPPVWITVDPEKIREVENALQKK